MYRVFAAAVAIITLSTAAASQRPEIPDASEFERELSDYRTYAWNKKQVPAENMANHLRFINAIQAQMKEHGYRLDTVNPEMRIQYHLKLSETLQASSTQQRSVWDDANSTVQIDFSREKAAHLSVELVEADSNFVLWQGKGTYPLGTPDRSERQIRAAVDDIFTKYPE